MREESSDSQTMCSADDFLSNVVYGSVFPIMTIQSEGTPLTYVQHRLSSAPFATECTTCNQVHNLQQSA